MLITTSLRVRAWPNTQLSSGGGHVICESEKPTCPRRLLQRIVRRAFAAQTVPPQVIGSTRSSTKKAEPFSSSFKASACYVSQDLIAR